MKTLLSSASAAFALALSSGSLAGEWNVGVLAGQTSFERFENISCSEGSLFNSALSPDFFDRCKDAADSNVAGLNVGYNFTPSLGVEVGYMSFDTFESDLTVGGDVLVGEYKSEPDVIHAALLGTLPITDRFSITGKLGYYDLDGNVEVRLFDGLNFQERVSKDDVYAGASANFAVTDNLTAQLRYDYFDQGVTSFGLNYSFGL